MSINPNTPIVGTETTGGDKGPVELRGGDSPISFDELDSVLSKKSKVKKEEKEVKSDKVDVKESKDAKSKDLTSDSDKGKKESKPDKGAKEAKSEEKQKEDPPPRKTAKAKYLDNEVDLDEEAIFSVKINGKEEPVMLKDLMGNYSGKTAWDKKFSELDKERKGISSKQMKVAEIESKIKSIFEEQDEQVKIFRMAELAGVSPIEFRQKFLDENMKTLEKWYSMSEDERKADALAFENRYLKHQHETQSSQIKQKEAQEALKAKIEKLRVPHGISEDQFAQRHQEIEEYVSQGKIAKEQATPEFIVETILKDNLWNAAASKVQELNLPWNEQQRGEKLLDLVEKAYKIGIKTEDIAEIVDELWGVKGNQKKVEAKKTQSEDFKTGTKPVDRPKKEENRPMFFDEI